MQTTYVALKRFLITIAEVYLETGDILIFDSVSGTLTVYRNQAIVRVINSQTSVGVLAMERTGLIGPPPPVAVAKPAVTATPVAPVVPVVPAVVPHTHVAPPTETVAERTAEEEAHTAKLQAAAATAASSRLEGLTREQLLTYAKDVHNLNLHPATGAPKIIAAITKAVAAASGVVEPPVTETSAITPTEAPEPVVEETVVQG